MPEVNDNKPSPLNIFMAFVNAIGGDIEEYQKIDEVIEDGKREWEKDNGNKNSFN